VNTRRMKRGSRKRKKKKKKKKNNPLRKGGNFPHPGGRLVSPQYCARVIKTDARVLSEMSKLEGGKTPNNEY